MKLIAHMIIFSTLFSGMFFWIRRIDIIPMHLLLAETDGIGLLYSTIGLIFGVISAFVIQTQWENWDKLSISVHGEIKSLKELLHNCKHLSPKFYKAIENQVQDYIQQVISSWHLNNRYDSSTEPAEFIQKLQETVYALRNKDQIILDSINQTLIRLVSYRNDIVHYGSRRLPIIIKLLIIFCTILVIFLPLFIGVRTLWLDYIITLSLALLAFLTYSVINDLDNPLRSGNWHITSKDYQKLLEKI